jgi:hypothetical protein
VQEPRTVQVPRQVPITQTVMQTRVVQQPKIVEFERPRMIPGRIRATYAGPTQTVGTMAAPVQYTAPAQTYTTGQTYMTTPTMYTTGFAGYGGMATQQQGQGMQMQGGSVPPAPQGMQGAQV